MKPRWALVILMVAGLGSVDARADCALTLRLAGCVQDAKTYKPLIGARVFYSGASVYTDEKGCFLINTTDTVPEGDFFPNYYCVLVYQPGYEFTYECERRESIEPFPPCTGSTPLYLSFHYGIILVSELTTGIETGDGPALPQHFELYQNYPNPFNPSTAIEFVLATAADVRLDIYDVRGGHVARLQEGRLPAGSHQVKWDASSRPAGVYFYRLRVNGETQTRKMVLLK